VLSVVTGDILSNGDLREALLPERYFLCSDEMRRFNLLDIHLIS
jgi:hypothetical protein